NTNISVVIDGMNVTFTATEDWFGSEVITFSVFDGCAFAYDTVTVTVNLTYLAQPVISSITKTGGNITISWSPVANAGLYRVYRSTDPYGEYSDFRGTTSLTTFVDDGAGTMDKLFYRIVAINE
ncbi:MAG TPA: hypothetical protein PL124_03390, partial [Candidatus Cloacimonadota bacterium]|nr:hypothetical protein [Candidatus Cloacimonadota bacterium]HPS38437.1 hypothetical protein [Candidatus Cloacimonadota bacterium]